MNRRIWIRVAVALLLVAIAVLELTAMASARRGFGVYFWSLCGLGVGALLVVLLTALVQLVRHRFRFSLGSLLLAFALLAVVLPLVLAFLHRVDHYHRVTRVLVRGISWQVESTAPDWVLKGLSQNWQYAFFDLTEVRATQPQDDDWVRMLDSTLGLRTLFLDDCQITERAIAHLGQVDTLRSLRIHKTPLDDSAWRHLAQLPQLETLELNEIPIGDPGLEKLAGCQRLKQLRISLPADTEPRITEAALTELRRALPHCQIDCPQTSDQRK